MKLSAAIRIGSMTTKQIKAVAHDGGNGRCAIGAALDAVGVKASTTPDTHNDYYPSWPAQMEDHFPICKLYVKHPITNEEGCMRTIIYDLNDSYSYGLSRDQIADWVETIEAQEEAKNAEKHNEVIENKVEVMA